MNADREGLGIPERTNLAGIPKILLSLEEECC